MSYAIWRPESRANVWMFDTEQEALAAVREAIRAKGADFAARWSLILAPEHGDWTTVAEGVALLERARLAHAEGQVTAARPRGLEREHE